VLVVLCAEGGEAIRILEMQEGIGAALFLHGGGGGLGGVMMLKNFWKLRPHMVRSSLASASA
jgi:hypothetical protein